MKPERTVSALMFYLLIVGTFLSVTYWGSRATTAIAKSIPLQRSSTVIIDAGHGGVDGGATSYTGKIESSFNLEIAQRLNDLMHLLGIHTKMVRNDDISVYTQGETIAAQKVSDLKNRVSIVNATENAVLISIHQNTFPDSRYSGAQVFYGPEGEGQTLAEELQKNLCETLNPGSTRQCKRAKGIYLMEHIERTGVLIECGFLSNPAEEAKLRSSSYQKQLCCVIAATVSNFLDR